jgi:capsular polysaccharide biosynthesis protein
MTFCGRSRLWMNIFGTNIAIISSDNKVIGEISYQYVQPNVSAKLQDSDIFKQKFFTKPVKYTGVVFSMLSGSRANDNIYHWLFDALPKLYLLKESGLFSTVDKFLVPSISRRFQRESLELMGITPDKIIEANSDIHIQADTLITSSYIRHQGHIPAWTSGYHQRAFVAKNQARTTSSPMVYIGRGDSKIRQVFNEPQLVEMLKKYGFETYLLSKLSFQEQVNVFASADVIVSAHGAGLANLTFCKPGTSVIEFFPQGYMKPTYRMISHNTGLDYRYLVCKSDLPENVTITAANVEVGMELSVHADIDKIESFVKEALANPDREKNLTDPPVGKTRPQEALSKSEVYRSETGNR